MLVSMLEEDKELRSLHKLGLEVVEEEKVGTSLLGLRCNVQQLLWPSQLLGKDHHLVKKVDKIVVQHKLLARRLDSLTHRKKGLLQVKGILRGSRKKRW